MHNSCRYLNAPHVYNTLLGKTYASSAGECCDKCFATPGCQKWNYHPATKQCQFRNFDEMRLTCNHHQSQWVAGHPFSKFHHSILTT